MRYVFLAVFVLLVAALVIFAAQNLQAVTVSFLGMSIHTPLALLAVGLYVLGAITGGSLLALLRQSYEGASHVFTDQPR